MPSPILAAVCYGSPSEAPLPLVSFPCLHHIAGGAVSKTIKKDGLTKYSYPPTQSRFSVPGHDDFDYATEAITHTRNLTFLKKYIRGVDFDLEAIWEEHCYFEFEDRSVARTMGTMVQEPYINHIPTASILTASYVDMKPYLHSQMTGGTGRTLLAAFYRDHFIFSNPPDVENELVSGTIGIDRVCDEFIRNLTHTYEVDWL